MTLARETVQTGVLSEYQSFGELVRRQSEESWQRPTRCEGWSVADVAAHVIGQLTDVVAFRLEGLGTPEVTARQVAERSGRRPGELADELLDGTNTASALVVTFDDAAWDAPVAGSPTRSLGFGLESLWFDTFVHADDIRDALGEPAQLGDGLVASMSHIAQELSDRGWPAATLAFEQMPGFAVSGGDGRRISGDPMTFVLVATGRGDPAKLDLDPSINIYG
jgi:uncharacterized protein (TIGR03083 family)